MILLSFSSIWCGVLWCGVLWYVLLRSVLLQFLRSAPITPLYSGDGDGAARGDEMRFNSSGCFSPNILLWVVRGDIEKMRK
jgi:hypothetical protein